MKKIILTLFLFFGLYIQNSSFADATRYFCTETWSNGHTTYTRENHCYGTQSGCEASCQIAEGCKKECAEDEDQAAPGFG